MIDQLATILLRLDGYQDQQTRRVLLDELAAETGEEIVPRGTEDIHQARSLVLDCAREPSVLAELADLVADFHGDTADTTRFHELARRLDAPPLLTRRERNALGRVLQPWEDGGWRGAFARAASLVPEPPRDVSHAVELLEDLVLPPGRVPPLVRFVLALGDHSSPGRRERMWRWAVAVAERLGVEQQWLYETVGENRPRESDRTILVLRLQPFLPARSEYLLSVWLGHGAGQWTPLAHEDEPQELEQIVGRIGAFLTTAVEYDAAGPSRVEFMLPRNLLNLPVDRWLVDAHESSFGTPLGARYPVVLRDLERQRNSMTRSLWKSKWDRLTLDRAAWRPPLVLDAGESGLGTSELAMRLEPALAVLVSGTSAWEENGASVPPQLDVALDSGVPVMVWNRRGNAASDRFLEDLAHRLSDGREVTRLPDTVRELRQRAFAAPHERIPSHLTLLWDDPHSLPVRTAGFGSAL